MHSNYFGLLDASQLLQLYETIVRVLAGLVFLGIAAEVVCLLLLWLLERRAPERRQPRQSTNGTLAGFTFRSGTVDSSIE